MLGFEIIFKDEVTHAYVEGGVASVIINSINNQQQKEMNLEIGGLYIPANPKEELEHIDWFHSRLKENDEIRIQVKEIVQPSKPIRIRKESRASNEDLLNTFYELQKELKEEGLLQ